MRFIFFLPAIVIASACVGDDSTTPKDSGLPDTSVAPDASNDAPVDVALVCEAGTADCDSNVAGCETSLLTSDTSCGSCGHDCGGKGLCKAGVCQPMAIAASVTGPISLSVQGASAFWPVDLELQRCAITGCPTQYPGDVADGIHVPKNSYGPWNIATDATNVYWPGYTTDYSTQSIYYCPLAGCGGNSPTTFSAATNDQFATEMAGNTANLYWLDSNNVQITRIRKSDKNIANLPMPNLAAITTMAVDDNHVLFTYATAPVNGGGVYVCKDATSDCAGKFSLLLDSAQQVATNGTLAIVNQTTNGLIVTCDMNAGCSGSGTTLSTGETNVTAITADATAVYWTIKGSGTDGTIRTCALPTCAGGAKTLATGQSNPRAIVNDASFVYWANQGTTTSGSGSVMRVRK